MTVRHIVTTTPKLLRARDGVLFETASSFNDHGELERLSLDLVDTMMAHDICVGLVAPQLGISARVVVIGPDRVRNNLIVMVDPVLVSSGGKKGKKRESCMSLPGYTGSVTRRENAVISYSDLDGTRQTLELSGFEARVAMHEMDHLDGVLFADLTANEGQELVETDLFANSNFDKIQEEKQMS